MKKISFSKHLKSPLFLLLVGALTFSACEKDDQHTFIDDNDVAQLFVSSNTSSQLTIFDLDDDYVNYEPEMHTMEVTNADADGVHYNASADVLYQLDRSNSKINVYQDFSGQAEATMLQPNSVTTSDFTNGREVTISTDGRYLVAAQDEDDKMGNRFMIYLITPFGLEFDRMFESSIDIWGIHFEGEHLFAVEDGTANLVAFYHFFDHENGEMIEPTVRLNIEGVRHLRGLDYDGVNDIMFLADIGRPDKNRDGAIIVIHDFSQKAAQALNVQSELLYQSFGFLLLHDQVRIRGNRTQLGNPVDVAFCRQNQKIYVAERSNRGGQMLEFDLPYENSNVKPTYAAEVAGASSVCIYVEEVVGF